MDQTIPKCDAVAKCLKEGMTRIHLDTRIAGVRVPTHYTNKRNLSLNLSWNFPKAKMTFDKEAIEATLGFKEGPFRVRIPWDAIWGAELNSAPPIVLRWPLERHCPACRGVGWFLSTVTECSACHGTGLREGQGDGTVDEAPPKEQWTPRLVVDNKEKPPEATSDTPKAPWLRLVK